jgi:hypothetical protein
MSALWGGIVLPFFLMAMSAPRRNPMVQIVASLLVMVALLISRYEFIIGGQRVPLFKRRPLAPRLAVEVVAREERKEMGSVKDNDIRADFFLTLTRAFKPPIGEAMQRGLVESLPMI